MYRELEFLERVADALEREAIASGERLPDSGAPDQDLLDEARRVFPERQDLETSSESSLRSMLQQERARVVERILARMRSGNRPLPAAWKELYERLAVDARLGHFVHKSRRIRPADSGLDAALQRIWPHERGELYGVLSENPFIRSLRRDHQRRLAVVSDVIAMLYLAIIRNASIWRMRCRGNGATWWGFVFRQCRGVIADAYTQNCIDPESVELTEATAAQGSRGRRELVSAAAAVLTQRPEYLTNRQWDILNLRMVNGLAWSQIAKHCSLSVGKVKQILEQALGQIHCRLERS